MSTAPVLDGAALRRLGEQLGDSDLLCGFLRRYLLLLDRRIDRLEHAHSCADQEDWVDAVLSLKTASVMAGARALAEQADVLQRESAACPSWAAPIASSAPAPAAVRRLEHMACLRRLASATARQLDDFVQQLGEASRPN